MEIAHRFLSGPESCGYLPHEQARMEYVRVARMDAGEYALALLAGWRRFGHTLFRPRCRGCLACLSLRVDVPAFRPDRSQVRCRRANEPDVALRIGHPRLTRENLDLYARFQASRAESHGWSDRDEDPASFADSFVHNPFPTEEWRYELAGRLVGLGYVDPLPVGLSAIYFVHDPDRHRRGLGTWNVLSLIDEAARRGLPHVYLGYYVAGCRSLAYKARFRPHQLLAPDGSWTTPDAPVPRPP